VALAPSAVLLLSGCASDDEEVVEEKHPEYTENNNFYTRDKFNYEKSNENGFEGITRKEDEILKHRPEVVISEKGKKVEISFAEEHPHNSKHYWAWIELRDYNGTTMYKDFEKPTEAVEKFSHTFESEEALEGSLRVRVFCNVHGEFMDYVKVPDFKRKTILDR